MKRVFADTSALYALLDKSDHFHAQCRDAFNRFQPEEIELVCSSYIVVETLALLQNRIGVSSVRRWQTEFEPILTICWVDADLHGRALTSLVASGRRDVSLTDWTSFLLMRRKGILEAFTCDKHFSEQGFQILS